MSRMNVKKLKTSLRKKLGGSKGFTLTELLATIIILGLTSVLMVNGIAMANDVYSDTVNAANSQTLMSTTLQQMKNMLQDATEIVDSEGTADGKSIRFKYKYRYELGGTAYEYRDRTVTMYCDESTGSEDPRPWIMLDYDTAADAYPLVPYSAGTGEFALSFDSIEYRNGYFLIRNVCVLENGVVKECMEEYCVQAHMRNDTLSQDTE